jgi:hypothetical protein
MTAAIDARRRITRQSLQKTPFSTPRVRTRKPPARLGPAEISVARLPVTGSQVFGRGEDIAFLDRAWANKDVNVVTFYVLDSERGDYAKLQRKHRAAFLPYLPSPPAQPAQVPNSREGRLRRDREISAANDSISLAAEDARCEASSDVAIAAEDAGEVAVDNVMLAADDGGIRAAGCLTNSVELSAQDAAPSDADAIETATDDATGCSREAVVFASQQAAKDVGQEAMTSPDDQIVRPVALTATEGCWCFVIANNQIAQAGKRSAVEEVVVGRARATEDMNICTGKFDIRPDYSVFWVGVDTDVRTKCEGVIGLHGGQLLLHRSVAGLQAVDLFCNFALLVCRLLISFC